MNLFHAAASRGFGRARLTLDRRGPARDERPSSLSLFFGTMHVSYIRSFYRHLPQRYIERYGRSKNNVGHNTSEIYREGTRDAWLACTRQVTSLKHRPPDWSTCLSPVGPDSRAFQAPLKRWETRRSISWKRDCGKSGSSACIIYKYHVVEGERERIGGVHRHANSQPVKFYDTSHWPVRYQVQQTEKRFARA